MNFVEAIKSGFRNYVTFSGRAARSEYWYWVLFVAIGGAAASILDTAIFPGTGSDFSPINSLFGLAVFLPGLALAFRRLHDMDGSAWWLLIFFTVVGAFVLLYWFCQKGTTGPNRFGPDPLGKADMTFCGANVRLCPKADIRPVAQRPGPELPPDPSVCYVEPVRRWMLGILGSRSMLTAELGPKRLGLLHQLLPDAAVVAMLINVSRDR